MSGKIHCDCGDHKEIAPKETKYVVDEMPSFHTIIKKIDKMFRNGSVILISKM